MNNYFTTFKINDHIYQIKEKMGVLMTLIIGTKQAMLIDTGYGLYNIKDYIYNNITKLPLIVIASHGHMDHTGGNYLFEKVYIHPNDLSICAKYNSEDWRIRNINNATKLNLINHSFDKDNYLKQREGNLICLANHQTFSLGNINIEVIPMEGHTQGSIGLYLKEDKYLVVTDATCPFVWLFLEESTSVSNYIKMLERIIKLDFTHVLLGHGKGELISKSRVFDFLATAKTININKSVKVTFNNFEQYNSYCYTEGTMYNQDDSGIIFDPNKI